MILSCWNVHGVTSCLPELTEVATVSHIVFISEHWLYKNNLSILNTSFPDSIYSIATPGISKNNITRGGIAFLIRKSTDFNIQDVRLHSERIMSIEIIYGANKLFIIGCLLPSTHVHFEEYKNVLAEVFDLFDELCEIGPVLICGDFNTDFINKATTSKSKLLVELMHDRNLCSIFKMENQYTFQTKNETSKSIIDYILVPEWLECEVQYKEIFNDFKYEISDHSPLFSEINISNIFQLLPPDMSRNIPKWSSADSKKPYKDFTETSQHLLDKTSVTISSTDDIDQYLVHITASLLSAADQHIPYGKFRPHLKPYWKK
jgi:exonuclease III